jgi:hypothetical protein
MQSSRLKIIAKDKPRGQISQTDDGRIEVWVKTWSELQGAPSFRSGAFADKCQQGCIIESISKIPTTNI